MISGRQLLSRGAATAAMLTVPMSLAAHADARSESRVIFQSEEELLQILRHTFEGARNALPERAGGYESGSVALSIYDLGLSVSIQGLGQEPILDELVGSPEAGISTDAETVDDLLSGRVGTPEVLTDKRLVATGDTELMSRLILLMPWLVANYPSALARVGRSDLRSQALKGGAERAHREKEMVILAREELERLDS